MKTKRFVVEVSDIGAQRFRNLLYALETSSNWGASRAFEIEWDGDGSDKLKVIESDIESNCDRQAFDAAINAQTIRVLSDGRFIKLKRPPTER